MINDHHEFALYVPTMQPHSGRLLLGSEFCINDEKLHHRMRHVLRLAEGDICILFDGVRAARAVIVTLSKKECRVRWVEHIERNAPHLVLTFLLPLLKKEALERALYSLVELGVQRIVLVATEKSQKNLAGSREMERLQLLIVSAAEQSKNFVLPVLEGPLSLRAYLGEHSALLQGALFADPQGEALYEVVQSLHSTKPLSLVMMVGPEGDLTSDEKSLLKESGFQFCRLTSSVLRAQQAVAVFVGAVRSLL